MNLEVVRTAVVMSPDLHDPREAWGVLNPASARSASGTLYLFPRMVAAGNFSRIGIVRVEFDADGNPANVRRLGIALEPHEPYEMVRSQHHGGVEDPRITYVPLLKSYVMTYTALAPSGPRIALAVSDDLFAWRRLGPLRFEPENGVDFNHYLNKDGVLLPQPVMDPAGNRALAVLHRPIRHVRIDSGVADLPPPDHVGGHPSIWISYASLDRVRSSIAELTRVYGHTVLATPVETWESDRIGAGAPPVLTDQGWLLFYHGVFRVPPVAGPETRLHTAYHGGVMVLDRHDPRCILWRSPKPLLYPSTGHGRYGHVPRVVFPTAVDVRGQDLDVYCGAADTRIVVVTVRAESHILAAPSASPEAAAPPEVIEASSQVA
jgi:beta-1,2-mannobiose phosphorylase / 1,2-beta-oligomannan phosphorylase